MRNLLGRLLDRPPQSLGAIARYWEIELRGPDLHHDVSLIYRTLTDPWNFALAWEGLSPVEQAILKAYADGTARDSRTLAGELNLNQDALLPSLRKLHRAGFLYHQDPSDEEAHPAVELFTPPELATLIAHLVWEQSAGDPSYEAVPVLLGRLDEARLIELARDLGYHIIPAVSQRSELAGYIATRLTNPDHIEAAVQALEPQAARLWRWLTQHPLPAAPGDACLSLGYSPVELRTAIQALARQGLIWRGYEMVDGGHGLRLVVPDVIRHPQRPEQEPPPELEAVLADPLDPVEWMPSHAAAWDLLTLLRDRMDRISHSPAVAMNGATSRRTGPQFWRGIENGVPRGYPAFLGYLVVGLGLAADESRLTPIGERIIPWTRLSFDEQTLRMISLWLNAAEWFEGTSQESLQAWGADWPGMRRNLLEALKDLGDGRWYTLDSFVGRFAASRPAALGAHVTLAAAEAFDQPAAPRRQAVLRRAVEITLIKACLWLGLVELAGGQGETRLIRLTPLGAAIAAGSRAATEEVAREAPPLVVQPNFEILLLAPTPRRVWALSAFADLVRLDRVSIYRLSEQSVLRALGGGASVGNVVRFLKQQSGNPLPQNVAYALTEWEGRHRVIGVREAVVLDLGGAPVPGGLERILHERGIAVERLPGDRLLVSVPRGEAVSAFAERIERALREVGHIPRRPMDR